MVIVKYGTVIIDKSGSFSTSDFVFKPHSTKEEQENAVFDWIDSLLIDKRVVKEDDFDVDDDINFDDTEFRKPQ